MKKYLCKPLTPELRAQITNNLALLPPHMRFKGKTTPQCDFCSSDNPQMIYAADRLSTGEPKKCLRWLACPECHALITANEFAGVYERVASIFKGEAAEFVKAHGIAQAALMGFHADAVQLP